MEFDCLEIVAPLMLHAGARSLEQTAKQKKLFLGPRFMNDGSLSLYYASLELVRGTKTSIMSLVELGSVKHRDHKHETPKCSSEKLEIAV